MSTVKYTLKKDDRLTEEELHLLEELEDRPLVYDEDNPPLTKEQLAQFYRVSEVRRGERRRQNVTLRLRPATIRKAKQLGKGYSGVLSRILEDVLNDPETLEKYL